MFKERRVAQAECRWVAATHRLESVFYRIVQEEKEEEEEEEEERKKKKEEEEEGEEVAERGRGRENSNDLKCIKL